MNKHVYDYSSTVWGMSYFTCRHCFKAFSEYEMEDDDTECPASPPKEKYVEDTDYSFMSNDEIRRRLGHDLRNFKKDYDR